MCFAYTRILSSMHNMRMVYMLNLRAERHIYMYMDHHGRRYLRGAWDPLACIRMSRMKIYYQTLPRTWAKVGWRAWTNNMVFRWAHKVGAEGGKRCDGFYTRRTFITHAWRKDHPFGFLSAKGAPRRREAIQITFWRPPMLAQGMSVTSDAMLLEIFNTRHHIT